MTNGRDDFARLRFYTAIVLLGLLVFVTIGNFIDDIAFGDKFHTDPAFYTLLAGMVTGIFAAETIKALRRNSNGNGHDK